VHIAVNISTVMQALRIVMVAILMWVTRPSEQLICQGGFDLTSKAGAVTTAIMQRLHQQNCGSLAGHRTYLHRSAVVTGQVRAGSAQPLVHGDLLTPLACYESTVTRAPPARADRDLAIVLVTGAHTFHRNRPFSTVPLGNCLPGQPMQ
jgi:hypothetical protein